MHAAHANYWTKPLLFVAVALGATSTCVAAGTSSGATSPTPRWSIDAGVGIGYLDDDVTTCAGGCAARFEVDARLSPFLRLSHSWTQRLALELDLRYDAYRWDLTGAQGERDSHFRSYTTAGGLTYRFGERSLGGLGLVRPIARVAIGYRILNIELDAPIRDFDNGFGGELALGLEKGRFAMRCGYSYYRHAAGATAQNASDTKPLILDEVFLEAAYRIASW